PPEVTLYQYIKGTTSDLNTATLYTLAESAGETAWKLGLASSIYPSYFTTARLDVQANISFPAPYKILRSPYTYPNDPYVTTFAQLQAGDQTTVKWAILAKMTAAEQDVVVNAVAGFFNRQDTDMANATAAAASTPYLTLKAINQTAANNWLKYANGSVAYPSGQDWADRFYIEMVKPSVQAYPAGFLAYWTMTNTSIQTLADIPSPATNDQIEAVSWLAGYYSFLYGTAGPMYPLLQYQTAVAMYPANVTTVATANMTTANLAAALAGLTATQKATVNAAVYGSLTGSFATVYGAYASMCIGSWRDGTAAKLAQYGLINATHTRYALCTGVEKAKVDLVISQTLPGGTLRDSIANSVFGKTYAACNSAEKTRVDQAVGPYVFLKGEKDYVDFSAVPGAILGWDAEMFPVKDYTKSMCYVTLQSAVGFSAANGWRTAVQSGVHPRQAFYRWLAYESVSASASMATLFQMSVGEFYFKVTNPNEYAITLDSLNINYAVTVPAIPGFITATSVDVAKLFLSDEIWVPAGGEIIYKTMVPMKTYDMITWLAMAGKSTVAGILAWQLIQAGTAVFNVTVEASISSQSETIVQTYTVQWNPTGLAASPVSTGGGTVTGDLGTIVGILGDFTGPASGTTM
ncbi:MAG: hypothetical protein NTU41_02450, partial [Chloroflexi bacterium]|nr:hypothetical protein [Chloroflexota bacterium]